MFSFLFFAAFFFVTTALFSAPPIEDLFQQSIGEIPGNFDVIHYDLIQEEVEKKRRDNVERVLLERSLRMEQEAKKTHTYLKLTQKAILAKDPKTLSLLEGVKNLKGMRVSHFCSILDALKKSGADFEVLAQDEKIGFDKLCSRMLYQAIQEREPRDRINKIHALMSQLFGNTHLERHGLFSAPLALSQAREGIKKVQPALVLQRKEKAPFKPRNWQSHERVADELILEKAVDNRGKSDSDGSDSDSE